MAIEDFRGLLSRAIVTKEMFEECQLVNSIFVDVATQITEREEQLRLEYNNAQALWEPWLWPDSVRMKHGLIAGGTGAGKSTFLENVIAQDLNRRFDGRPMPMIIFDGKGDQDFLERLLRRLSGKHGCLRGSSHPSRVSAIPCGRRLENSDSKY